MDVLIHNFKQHTSRQWELIHAELGQLFNINPPLKKWHNKEICPRTLEPSEMNGGRCGR